MSRAIQLSNDAYDRLDKTRMKVPKRKGLYTVEDVESFSAAIGRLLDRNHLLEQVAAACKCEASITAGIRQEE